MNSPLLKIVTLIFFGLCISSFVAFRAGAFKGNVNPSSNQDSIPPQKVIAPSSKSDVIIPSSKYFVLDDEILLKKADTVPEPEEPEIIPSSKSGPMFDEKDFSPSSKWSPVVVPDDLKEKSQKEIRKEVRKEKREQRKNKKTEIIPSSKSAIMLEDIEPKKK